MLVLRDCLVGAIGVAARLGSLAVSAAGYGPGPAYRIPGPVEKGIWSDRVGAPGVVVSRTDYRRRTPGHSVLARSFQSVPYGVWTRPPSRPVVRAHLIPRPVVGRHWSRAVGTPPDTRSASAPISGVRLVPRDQRPRYDGHRPMSVRQRLAGPSSGVYRSATIVRPVVGPPGSPDAHRLIRSALAREPLARRAPSAELEACPRFSWTRPGLYWIEKRLDSLGQLDAMMRRADVRPAPYPPDNRRRLGAWTIVRGLRGGIPVATLRRSATKRVG